MTAKNKYHRHATHSRLRILTLQNIRSARRNWAVSATQIATLKTLTQEMQLSVSAGDLILLDGRWYVTHAGLMRLAHQHRCIGINVRPVPEFCEPTSSHWVFEATAYKFGMAKGFVGYGDADPANVSPLVRGAEMRVAETRAVNRALRKATESDSAVSKSLGHFPLQVSRLRSLQVRMAVPDRTAQAVVSPGCATNFAC